MMNGHDDPMNIQKRVRIVVLLLVVVVFFVVTTLLLCTPTAVAATTTAGVTSPHDAKFMERGAKAMMKAEKGEGGEEEEPDGFTQTRQVKHLVERSMAWSKGMVFNGFSSPGGNISQPQSRSSSEQTLAKRKTRFPTALSHGMGDSCLNIGMDSITHRIKYHTGMPAYCIPDGYGVFLDTINGFLSNMDKQVDFFAKQVKRIGEFQQGFNAIGLSQGNLVIRGYIERYNDPPVMEWISIHGPMTGVASIPQCDPDIDSITGKFCDFITDSVSDVAYSAFAQNLVAQTNFLRDPKQINRYLSHVKFLPDINNERQHPNMNLYKRNFESLKTLVAVKALQDTMIWPSESEWFGSFEDGSWEKVLQMNETTWWKQDLFGLRKLVDGNRLHFETTRNNHLDFTEDDLFGWIDKYFEQGSFRKENNVEMDEATIKVE